jgi:hypothetical protein
MSGRSPIYLLVSPIELSTALTQLATTRYPYASSAIGRSRGAGRAAGEWYEPRELAPVRGLIGRVGIPPRLQALVHHEKLAIHLIGYETEEESISATRSLRGVSAD